MHHASPVWSVNRRTHIAGCGYPSRSDRRIVWFVARAQPLIDEWTPVHFASGVLMAAVGLRPLDALIASAAWEVLENVVAEAPGVKEIIPRAGAESVENALFDIVINMLGYGTAHVLLGDRSIRWTSESRSAKE
jgi:hypothetical protein